MNANNYTELTKNEKRNINKYKKTLTVQQISTRFNIQCDKIERYYEWLKLGIGQHKSQPRTFERPDGYFNHAAYRCEYSLFL
jgi:hypothetical protein